MSAGDHPDWQSNPLVATGAAFELITGAGQTILASAGPTTRIALGVVVVSNSTAANGQIIVNKDDGSGTVLDLYVEPNKSLVVPMAGFNLPEGVGLVSGGGLGNFAVMVFYGVSSG